MAWRRPQPSATCDLTPSPLQATAPGFATSSGCGHHRELTCVYAAGLASSSAFANFASAAETGRPDQWNPYCRPQCGVWPRKGLKLGSGCSPGELPSSVQYVTRATPGMQARRVDARVLHYSMQGYRLMRNTARTSSAVMVATPTRSLKDSTPPGWLQVHRGQICKCKAIQNVHCVARQVWQRSALWHLSTVSRSRRSSPRSESASVWIAADSVTDLMRSWIRNE